MVLSKIKAGLNSLASAEFNRINVSETADLPGHWEAMSGGGSPGKNATSLQREWHEGGLGGLGKTSFIRSPVTDSL
jgi:hypothetical protein